MAQTPLGFAESRDAYLLIKFLHSFLVRTVRLCGGFFMEATPLCSLLNKLHLLRRIQHRLDGPLFFWGGGFQFFLRRIRNISKGDC